MSKAIKIVENKWRPFIVLHDVEDDNEVYFDVTKRPTLIQEQDCTGIFLDDGVQFFVQEKIKDIIKAVDKLIDIEADKKAEQAREYMQATMDRAKATAERLEKK